MCQISIHLNHRLTVKKTDFAAAEVDGCCKGKFTTDPHISSPGYIPSSLQICVDYLGIYLQASGHLRGCKLSEVRVICMKIWQPFLCVSVSGLIPLQFKELVVRLFTLIAECA